MLGLFSSTSTATTSARSQSTVARNNNTTTPADTSGTTTATATATATATTSSSLATPIPSVRRSASQVAQRLSSSWSGSTTTTTTTVTAASNNNNNKDSPRSSSFRTREKNIPFPRSASSKTSTSPTNTDNNNDTLSANSPDERSRPSFLRRLSPGLAARVKLLDGNNNNNNNNNSKTDSASGRSRSAVGRIPQTQLRELDSLHQDLSIKVQKRGRAWSGGRVALAKQESAPYTEQEGLVDQDKIPGRPGTPDKELETTAAERTPPLVKKDTTTGFSPGEAEESMSTVETAVSEQAGMSHGSETASPPGQSDLEKYLSRSAKAAATADQPPPPPPKDSPPVGQPGSNTNNVESYFNPLGLRRTESIFSFSRVSFSSQLSQLTSISLPQPASLAASISAIPTAPAAIRALTGATEQIQKWIDKASDVLGGLDAEDDVEWAAAGGREGLDDVDNAVTKFESLVNVYVKAIEDVQLRNDIADVGPDQLTTVVEQMETTLKNWKGVRDQLKGVKEQVELAMEWEELWSAVLGDVGMEIDSLARLIFEMEEKRHKTMVTEAESEPASGLDINELETIVEESPANGNTPVNPGFSLAAPVFDTSSSQLEASNTQTSQDDSNLLALFARMQPLRASLDFLPMRLSMFQSRAEKVFPSACEELEDRRQRLEKGYKKLETDAEALRRELGEDRWILVFRNAGKQAQKMCESVERSVNKLQEAIDAGIQLANPTALAKRVESFEAKKVHYGPAIERVLSIIQKGINDRLTVNGEIIRLQADLKARSEALQERMNAMEALLDELNANRNGQLRDSISSIVTIDSPATRSAIDTPESSPASSVVMSAGTGKGPSRRGSTPGSTVSRTTATKMKRYSALPQPSSTMGQAARRSSHSSHLTSPSPRLSATSPSPTITPRPASRSTTSPTSIPTRPRWNSSSNTNDLIVGHNFKPLSATTPSPYRKGTPHSSLPLPSPLSRESSASPAPGTRRPTSRLSTRLASPAPPASGLDRSAASPTPTRSILDPPPYSKLRKTSTPASGAVTPALNVPRSRQSYAGKPSIRTTAPDSAGGGAGGEDGKDKKTSRPGTALGHSSRRTSLLPQPRARSGRESSLGGSTKSSSTLDGRPPWR